MNPFWAYIVEFLPLWLAPNMVTSIGKIPTYNSKGFIAIIITTCI